MSAAFVKLANASSSSWGRALHLNLPKVAVADTRSALPQHRAASGAARTKAAEPDASQRSGLACWFGQQHYGRPMSQVAAEDPGYCRWILRVAEEDTSSRQLQQAAAWLSLNAPHLKDGSEQLRAGLAQYLSKLAVEDPAYCQWILREAKGGDASPKIRAMADWLVENAPHVQERGVLVSGRTHHGRPISELVTEDPVFCQWALQKAEERLCRNAWYRCQASQAQRWQGMIPPTDAVASLREGVFCTSSDPSKHRGRPMQEVVAEDPAYCLWVLQQAEAPTASHGLREMAKWLTANASHLKDKGCFASGGKYHGRPMSDLVTEDASYCKWVLRRAKDPSSSQTLREKALWLKEHAPHLEEQLAAKVEAPITGVRKGKEESDEEFLSRLVAEDPSYCLWILRAAKEKEASRKLRDRAAWLSKHAPHLKETQVVRMRSVHRGIPLPQLVAEDPRWCRFVLDQVEAKCEEFTEVAVWLRENAPELREASSDSLQDDEPIIEELSRRMLERYGQWFVIRHGKHRMKTFAAVVEEAPSFVRWAEKTVARNTAEKGAVGRNSNNFKLLVAFARQLRSKETDTEVTFASGQILTEGFAPRATEIMAA
ncbi:unnamed protein product [Symbiodinium sp. CCMP2592]|nr:unnamed protein product [Symbiodinium sp. CCMP2592]